MPAGNLTRAAVGFEQSRSPADLLRVVEALDGWLDKEEVELRRVFSDWIGEMDVRMRRRARRRGGPSGRWRMRA